MDAGLAAVLGAAVGALGTGGAAITAAVITKSQARLQLRAEYARSLREPRKVAYVALAEVAIKFRSHLTTACAAVRVGADNEPGLATPTVEARAAYDHLSELAATVDHLRAAVDVEGPVDVRLAAAVLARDMAAVRNHLIDQVHALEAGARPTNEAATKAQELQEAVHTSYLKFLNVAYDALRDDGLSGQ
ncbi:hypothetical protein [Streptomyces collinus]|uniref:hypothetical protein n=1 Tax=Streptomyces collinus TaxID=42684 RepID=UPI003807FB73